MIDREARTRLAALIRRYLNEEIAAFGFDEALEEFRDSADETVSYVAATLWLFYDDCDNHLVVLSKPGWDYLQRVLLLLESKSTVTLHHERHWAFSQVLAAVLVVYAIVIFTQTGMGYHLFLYLIPCGLGSIAISRMKSLTSEPKPLEEILIPFESIGDLRIAYEGLNFKKVRYPVKLATRRIRSLLSDRLNMIRMYLFWWIFAPIVLLFQCFPTFDRTIKVNPA